MIAVAGTKHGHNEGEVALSLSHTGGARSLKYQITSYFVLYT